jgi:hypothetical protein
MKKKLFLSSAILLLTSSVAFAQYEDLYTSNSATNSSISGWLTFYLIIMILFGILQIILFFKVWGMTNDMDKIKVKLVDKDERPTYGRMEFDALEEIVKKLYYIEKNEDAYDVLNKYVFFHFVYMNVSFYVYTDENKEKYIHANGTKTLVNDYMSQIRTKVQPLYAKIEKTIPEALSKCSYEEFKNFIGTES